MEPVHTCKTTTSLCFQDASRERQNNKITEETYLGHLIVHLHGVRHPEDSRPTLSGSSPDPFGGSIRDMVLETDYPTMQDTDLYDKLFRSCLTGRLPQVRLDIERLAEQSSYPVPLQPFATLAASKRIAEILQFCLEKGAIFHVNLDKASYYGAEYPPMLDVLLPANWRDLPRSKSTLDDLVGRSAFRDVSILTWLLDYGATVSHETIKQAAMVGTPVPMMALLVEKCGGAKLKVSCALQLAARRGEREMVDYLLRVGVDVEEKPTQLGDIRGPAPFTALYEAVQGQHVEIVQVLLEHGAKADAPCEWSKGHVETPLQAARRQGNR